MIDFSKKYQWPQVSLGFQDFPEYLVDINFMLKSKILLGVVFFAPICFLYQFIFALLFPFYNKFIKHVHTILTNIFLPI